MQTRASVFVETGGTFFWATAMSTADPRLVDAANGSLAWPISFPLTFPVPMQISIQALIGTQLSNGLIVTVQ